MGCSPSKGSNFGSQGPFRRGRTLLPRTEEVPNVSQFEDGGSGGSSKTGDTDGDTLERGGGKRRAAAQTHSSQREAPSTPLRTRGSLGEVVPEGVVLDKLGAHEIEMKTLSQGKEKHGDKQETLDRKSGRKMKKSVKGGKQTKKKETEKKAPIAEQKVDFPEPLVKAHQAAYAFLNPSISKYEILLGLLDQATQTQVSVQPMVAFLAMRYEGINQGLRAMADEGEKLLKENGEHLAWPSQMKNLSSAKPSKSVSSDTDPPPDLLHQLLQYTTQRMRNVGQSVGGIGDSALEDAAQYFTSVAELLEDKLKAKRATEARLMQLLSRIEAASLRKPGPDDSALFSEDSGIGAESESLAGSERRLRSGSCESTGTLRTFPCSPIGGGTSRVRQGALRRKFIYKLSPSASLDSIDSTCTIMANNQRDTDSLLESPSLDDGEDDGDDDEDDNDDDIDNAVVDGDDDEAVEHAGGGEGHGRKRSEPTPRRLPHKRIENPQIVEMSLKMKDAISGRIHFVPSRCSAKPKPTESPKTSRNQWADEERTPRRPQTAALTRKAVKKAPVAKERRSRSEESLRSKAEDPTLLELERTQRDLGQRLESMTRGKTAGTTKTNPSKHSPASTHLRPALERKNDPVPVKDGAGLTKRNTGEREGGKDREDEKKKKDKKTTKGPLKATPPPSPPLNRPPSGLCRGRNSVKKLIDTFSQGMEEPKQEPIRVLGPLKGVRKCGVPVLPGLGNVELALSNGLTSCRDDLDLDSLPPPPLEVLLDKSFEDAQSQLVVDDVASSRGRSPAAKKVTVSQRLRATRQSVTVLPSRSNMPQGSRSMSPARSVRKPDISATIRVSQPEVVSLDVDPETNETASLYKQARKIIHLQHSSDSAKEKTLSDTLPERSTPTLAGSGVIPNDVRQDVSSPPEIVPLMPVVSSQPSASPSASRTRTLPSTPSTPTSLHRRLPCPPPLKRQPTPPSSDSPAVIRKLPTPPPLQKRLPSPPPRRQMTPNSNSSCTYPLKAPSPPASPRLQRRMVRENSSEDSNSGASFSSRMMTNARSVFCPASPSLFEVQPRPRPPQAWTSVGVSVLPRPWGDRGRLPMSARGPRPFIRRSLSDRRPSLTLPTRTLTMSVAQTCGSEPALNLQGLEDEPGREDQMWNSQSDLRGTARSASQPDLCVVGQALYRDGLTGPRGITD